MTDEQPLQPYVPPATELERRERAKRRLERKRALNQHLTSYAIVQSLLILIWVITTPSGYFWPIWPILGWGVGIAFHVASLRWAEPPDEAAILAEAQRLRELDARRPPAPGSGPQDRV